MPDTSDKKIHANNASSAFLAERERIISLSYKTGGSPSSTDSPEIIDIVNDYPWIQDISNSKNVGKTTFFSSIMTDNEDKNNNQGYYQKKSKVPVCYAVERKNAVNGSITMILSMLGMVESVAEAAKEAGKLAGNITNNITSSNAGNILNALGDKAGDIIHGFKKGMTALLDNVFTNTKSLRSRNNLLDEILLPYRYLYYTVPTSKRYVFPMLNKDSSCFITSKLSWKKAELKLPGDMLNKAVKSGLNFLEAGAEFGAFIKNVNSIADSSGNSENDIGYFNEKPQNFKYPDGGELINLEFTLYNTTKKNAWKDNYRFLLLFALRNLPFKISQFTFVPPLLYDIFIPGVKRLPVAALNQMQVTPQGLTRTLELENFIGERGNKIQVSVPEAWQIKLVFQSLISPSANLLLAPVIGKLNITVPDEPQPVKYGSVEQARDKAIISDKNEVEKLQESCEKIREYYNRKVVDKQIDLVHAVGISDRLEMVANQAWRSGASRKTEQQGLEWVLNTFGETCNDPYTDEDIIKASELLIKYGYAEKNPKYGTSGYDSSWDYIKRRTSTGGIDNKTLVRNVLTKEQINNLANHLGIDYEHIADRYGPAGIYSLPNTKGKRENYSYPSYDKYKKPDGSTLTKEDFSWLMTKNPEKTYDYWYLDDDTEYLTEDELNEALQAINIYNQAIKDLEAANASEGIEKTTPICDDVLSNSSGNNTTK